MPRTLWGSQTTGPQGPQGEPGLADVSPLYTDADYTVLDDDGYTDIFITCDGHNRTVTLPTAADNVGRKIRIINSDGAGTVLVAVEGGNAFANGEVAGGSVSIPLFSRGDSITLIPDGDTAPFWAVLEAKSAWCKRFSYGAGFSDDSGGTYVKREGFQVWMQVHAFKGAPTSPGTVVFTLDDGLRPPGGITCSVNVADSLGGFNDGAIIIVTNGDGLLDYIYNSSQARGAFGGLSWRVV